MIKKTIALGLIGGSLVFAFLILFGDKQTAPPINENKLWPPTQARAELIPEINPVIADQKQADIGSLDPAKLADEILNNNLKDFDLSRVIPEIDSKDIKITVSTDKTASANYFKNLAAISEKNLGSLKIDFSNPSLEDLLIYSKAYQKIVEQLYQLIVPQNLAYFHKEELRLLSARRNIFKNLADYQTDPILALASANILPTVDEQFQQLIRAEMDFIKNNNLEI